MRVQRIHSKGDDLVLDAARASFGRRSSEFTMQKNERLIKYLAEHNHWSPFAHPRYTFEMEQADLDVYTLTPENTAGMVVKRLHTGIYKIAVRHSLYGWVNLLPHLPARLGLRIATTLIRHHPVSFKHLAPTVFARVQAEGDTLEPLEAVGLEDAHFQDYSVLYEVPIFVARQEFKHIVGAVRNERSGRYVSSDIACYKPEQWRKKPEGSIKQGSGDNLSRINNEYQRALYWGCVNQAMREYGDMLNDGVAPEMARMVLPQSMMTSYVVTGSRAMFRRFIMQRQQPDAQAEIQHLAALVQEELGL